MCKYPRLRGRAVGPPDGNQIGDRSYLGWFCRDIWFTCIYVGFALRLSHDYGTDWFFALAVLSGLSHLVQANITDYYKTLHLYFISKDKGAEFQSLEQVRARHKEMKYGINKFFYFLYRGYTLFAGESYSVLAGLCFAACMHGMEMIFRKISVSVSANKARN